jgi:hypothetical protein
MIWLKLYVYLENRARDISLLEYRLLGSFIPIPLVPLKIRGIYMGYTNSNPSFQSFREPVSTSRANLIILACPFYLNKKKNRLQSQGGENTSMRLCVGGTVPLI